MKDVDKDEADGEDDGNVSAKGSVIKKEVEKDGDVDVKKKKSAKATKGILKKIEEFRHRDKFWLSREAFEKTPDLLFDR